MDKQQWRRKAGVDRARLTIDSAAHCEQLSVFLQRRVPAERRIVVYDAMPEEVDLSAVIDGHHRPERRYAITRTPDDGNTLSLHPHGSPSETHRYGYRQPVADAPIVPDAAIGAVLVPGLAFDRSGVRLGRGKGYYDRLLARLDAEVLRVGITGGYIVESLPAESFDVAMTHLANRAGVWAVPVPRSEVHRP